MARRRPAKKAQPRLALTQGGAAFQTAVLETNAVSAGYRPGLQALLKADRARLISPEVATGSLDLDGAVRARHPNDHRWDYAIGLPHPGGGEGVLWLEPHHAASGEAQRVIDKLTWLQHWLRNQAPALARLPRVFVWHLTNVETNPNDRRRRMALAQAHGLRRVQGRLDLSQVFQQD